MTTSVNRIHDSAALRWWPLALGVAVAAGQAFGAGRGFATIVLVCAAIYLLAAVVGRRGAAWWGFAASLPLVGLAVLLRDERLSLALVGAAAVVLVVIGIVRGTWRSALHRAQLLAAAGFGAIAAVAVVAGPPVAGPLVIAGLLGHAVWDVVHHRRGVVVTRSYAEFCAALDAALAILVAVLLILGR